MVCTGPLFFLPVCFLLLLIEWEASSGSFTLKKLECLKQAYFCLEYLAWDNRIGLRFYFVGF